MTRPRFRPLDASAVASHFNDVAATTAVPYTLAAGGFAEEDLEPLMIAGHPNGDVSFAVTDEMGRVVAIKRRLAGRGAASHEVYDAATLDHPWTPAWVSPDAMKSCELLIVHGELNGMAAWLARPELAVVGAPGLLGRLPRALLAMERVFILQGCDDESRCAAYFWRLQALRAGASHVVLLEAMADGDPSQIAGTLGRAELRARLP